LYFRTSKASKLNTAVNLLEERQSVSICTFVLVKASKLNTAVNLLEERESLCASRSFCTFVLVKLVN
jgi:hypothetical protein